MNDSGLWCTKRLFVCKYNVDLWCMCAAHFYFKLLRKEKPKILPNVLYHNGNTPLVKVNRIGKSAGLECDICESCQSFENHKILSCTFSFSVYLKCNQLTFTCTFTSVFFSTSLMSSPLLFIRRKVRVL